MGDVTVKQGGQTIYSVEKEEQLVCPKCGREVEYLLGEGKFQACEQCYDSINAPPVLPDKGEVVRVAGEDGSIGDVGLQTQADQLKDLMPKE